MINYYKIDSKNLEEIFQSLNQEESTFRTNTKDSFSKSYLSSCTDDNIAMMSNKIKDYLNIIEKGYKYINKWLGDYTSDFNNVELGLALSKSMVKDEATNEALKKVIDYNDIDMHLSPDLMELLHRNNKIEKLPLIIDPNSDNSGFYQKLPLIIDPNSSGPNNSIVMYSSKNIGRSQYDSRSFGESGGDDGSRSLGGFQVGGTNNNPNFVNNLNTLINYINQVEKTTSFSDFFRNTILDNNNGPRSLGGFGQNNGSRSFGGYHTIVNSEEYLHLTDYQRIIYLMNDNPQEAKSILTQVIPEVQLNEMIKLGLTNEEIAYEYYRLRKRKELLAMGLSESQASYYLRFYNPRNNYLLVQAAVDNGYKIEENGIIFVSDTYEHALELQNYYHEFMNYGNNRELMKSVSAKSIEQGQKVYITDLDYSSPSGGYCSKYIEKDGRYIGSDIINISINSKNYKNYDTLTHELGHHLRNAAFARGDYSEYINGAANEDLYIIASGKFAAINPNFEKFKNDFMEFRKQFYKNVDTIWSEQINQEVDDEIRKKYNGVLPSGQALQYERNAIRQKVITKYYTQALSETGYSAISDIYDALGYSAYEQGMFGHGQKYFNDNPGFRAHELAANLTDLYFNGQWHLVEENFPPDVVKEWERIIMTYYK